MKKLIALSIVLTVFASVAFAQDGGLSYGAWGRSVFAPIRMVKPDGADSKVYTGVGKWDPYSYVSFSIKAEWDNVWAQGDLELNVDGKNLAKIGSHAYIWAKPWDFLRINAGKFEDNTLRGTFGDTSFSGDITLGTGGNDDIFKNFAASGLGGEIILTPIEGLHIGVLVPGGAYPSKTDDTALLETKYAFQKIQIGAGYKIPDIGHARLQFIGNDGTFDDPKEDDAVGTIPTGNASRVELAFELTAVENLKLDLGTKIWFAANKEFNTATTDDELDTKDKADKASVTNSFPISLGAEYTLDDFVIWGRVDAKIGGAYKVENFEAKKGFELNTHLVPSYNLGFATIGADIGFKLNPTTKTTGGGTTTTIKEGGVEFGLGAWIQKDLASGLIKTGIGVQLPTTKYKIPGDAPDEKNPMVLTIPIILEYWL
jgi:hypothetical protein